MGGKHSNPPVSVPQVLESQAGANTTSLDSVLKGIQHLNYFITWGQMLIPRTHKDVL